MDPVLQGSIEICKVIQRALDTEEGALIGRNGTIELEQMISFNKNRLTILETNAGIFPFTIVEKWRSQSIDATKQADILATGWYNLLKELEQIFLKNNKCKAIQIPLRSLEPYYVPFENMWTTILSGHSVSVVSCFTKTMASQVVKMNDIWPSLYVLPSDIKWNWVQTGHAPSVADGINEWPSDITNSLEAVDYIVSEVVKQGSRFALIGCGGIGMLVGLKLKERGVIAIVLGGAIQVLFGIKGQRWITHPIISKFWNDHWVFPSEDETPGRAKSIEYGCYW